VWILLTGRRVRINTLIAAAFAAGLQYPTYDTIDPENDTCSDIQYIYRGRLFGHPVIYVLVTNVS
jgi:hypothetical protein